MKRYYFDIRDEESEIQDLEGVLLPDDAGVADFFKRLILEVASEETGSAEPAAEHWVTVVDDSGTTILTVDLGDTGAKIVN